MYDRPVGYPKGKGGFPWLVQVRVNSKKVIVVFFKIIMEDFDDFYYYLASRVKVFIWYFMSEGSFSIILRIPSGAVEEEPEDENGFVIGYTHKGGGTIIELMAGGFLER